MKFKPSTKKLRAIIERRFINIDDNIKLSFPSIIQNSNFNWVSFGDKKLLALIIVTSNDLERIRSYQNLKYDSFPGLLTTKDGIPSAFKMESSRFGVMKNCKINNTVSFSIGKDSSFIIENHTINLTTDNHIDINYSIPLGYFVSFGEEVTVKNIYSKLEELIVYSIKTWRAIS